MLIGRVALITPSEFGRMEGRSISDCRLLILVTAGRLDLRVNGREYEMRAGSFLDLLNRAGVEILRIGSDLRAYCLLPTYEFTNESVNGLKPGPENYFQERLYQPVISLSEADCGRLGHLLEELETALSDVHHFYRNELVQTRFKIFLLELGNIMLARRGKGEKSLSSIGRSDIITTDFLKMVWKHFRTEHNIEFYAEGLNVSSKHLSRTVKKILGKTPREVISGELLQYSLTLLRNNELSIMEISAALHFSEQAAFCKFFKKRTGVAPSEYRKTAGAKETVV